MKNSKLYRLFLGHETGELCVAFSPDGKLLASGDTDGVVRIWDVNINIELDTLKGHSSEVTSVTFSPDGKTLATASSIDGVRLWDVNTTRLLRIPTQRRIAANCIVFSPDGSQLAGGGMDGSIRLWDVNTGTPLTKVWHHPDWIGGIAFSPDGTTLASAGGKTIQLYDVDTGQRVYKTFTGHTAGITSVVYTPDGKHIASGSEDGTILLWDLTNKTE